MFTEKFKKIFRFKLDWKGIHLLTLRPSFLLITSFLALLPILGIGYFHWCELKKLREIEAKICIFEIHARAVKKVSEAKLDFKNRFQRSNPNYLVEQIASHHFLQDELDLLERLYAQPPFDRYHPLEEKISSINKLNRVVNLQKRDEVSKYGFTEKTFSQIEPAVATLSDCDALLEMVEEKAQSGQRPCVLVTEFELKRQREDLFSINFSLLQRDID